MRKFNIYPHQAFFEKSFIIISTELEENPNIAELIANICFTGRKLMKKVYKNRKYSTIFFGIIQFFLK